MSALEKFIFSGKFITGGGCIVKGWFSFFGILLVLMLLITGFVLEKKILQNWKLKGNKVLFITEIIGFMLVSYFLIRQMLTGMGHFGYLPQWFYDSNVHVLGMILVISVYLISWIKELKNPSINGYRVFSCISLTIIFYYSIVISYTGLIINAIIYGIPHIWNTFYKSQNTYNIKKEVW